MKRSRPKAYRGNRKRLAPQEDATWWEAATRLLLARCNLNCERCGEYLGMNVDRHHRQVSAVGGDRIGNLLMLHSWCHQYIHAHSEEARTNGWIVSRFHPNPAEVPIRTPGGWVRIGDDGTKSPFLLPPT